MKLMVKIEVYTTPHLCERDHHCLFGPLSAREWSILFAIKAYKQCGSYYSFYIHIILCSIMVVKRNFTRQQIEVELPIQYSRSSQILA